MKKYKVQIKEEIWYTFEVEEFNEYMAKRRAKELLLMEQRSRTCGDFGDIVINEISSETTPKKKKG